MLQHKGNALNTLRIFAQNAKHLQIAVWGSHESVHGGKRVRAMGAHREGPGACIGGLEADGCGRSGMGSHGGRVGLGWAVGSQKWATGA